MSTTRTDEGGWVYVMSNPSMPGMLKIGLTTRNPFARLAELSGDSSTPTPFQMEMMWSTPDPHQQETRCHEALAHLRVNKRREFFKLNTADALRKLGPVFLQDPTWVNDQSLLEGEYWRRRRYLVRRLGRGHAAFMLAMPVLSWLMLFKWTTTPIFQLLWAINLAGTFTLWLRFLLPDLKHRWHWLAGASVLTGAYGSSVGWDVLLTQTLSLIP